MTLEDLIEVWRSQDEAPLHGVNETLLRLALRHDEAKVQRERRLGMWITYLMCACFVGVMALCLGFMIYNRHTGWDLAIPIVGAVAALIWPAAVRASYRAQARREDTFGASLRDQLERHIAQLDYHAWQGSSRGFWVINNLPATVWSAALILALLRIKGEPLSELWTDTWLLSILIGSVVASQALGVWLPRHLVQRHLLPHKRRLEGLLKEFDERAPRGPEFDG